MRKMLVFGTVPMIFIVIGILILDLVLSAPAYTGSVSDHFDGERFHNQTDVGPKGFGSLLKWRLTKEQGAWRDWVNAMPGPKPPEKVDGGDLRITFVNHSTVLIQMDGINILTDANWSDRASPFSFAGPKRVRPPGIRFEDLPPIAAVVVSHNHYDHLDLQTLKRLQSDHNPLIVSGLGNKRFLEDNGIDGSIELDWWQSRSLQNGTQITCVPAQHWSARGMTDRMKTLWCGFVIEGPSGNVYFAGDTGYGIHFEQIAKRFGTIRMSLLPIGAYKPRWFMESSHLSPSDAIRAFSTLGTTHATAIHFGTFNLGDDGETEAADELQKELQKSDPSVQSNFWILDFGEGRNVPR